MPRDGWARYTTPPWIVRHDGARIVPEAGRDPAVELVQSWDFTFKDTKSSDYVVGQVWLRRGPITQLVDQVRARMSFTESCVAMTNMTARWPQAIAKLVEDKANGPAIINALGAKVGGIIPVEPEGSKYARAVAVSPFVEAGNIQLPDPSAVEGTSWVSDLIEEAADFPGAANDDTVDAMSQANHRLLLVPLLNGDTLDASDILGDDEDDALPWAASY
jgi:predicted phage terminase large subunit-like protein